MQRRVNEDFAPVRVNVSRDMIASLGDFERPCPVFCSAAQRVSACHAEGCR